MPNLVPFSFDNHPIRVATDDQGTPWFVAKDVAETLGYDQTANGLKHCKGASVLDELNKNNGLAPATKWIQEADVYRMVMRSTLPDAERFQDWVVEDVLPTIRKTGRYDAKPDPAPTRPRIVKEAFSAGLHIAKLCGITGNHALLSADLCVKHFTGRSALALIGATHLMADRRGQTYNPTELGKMCDEPLTPRAINKLLEERGFQVHDIKGEWVPTDAAAGHYEWADTARRYHDGTPVKQLKWFTSILDKLGLAYATAKREPVMTEAEVAHV